jgi:radical SAM superfamily enzyme YgiQ (UPF0313 family)
MHNAGPHYDIVFIVPHYRAGKGFIWKSIEYRFQSPGVLSLASFIQAKGYKTSIMDCNLEQIREEDFQRSFRKRYENSTFKSIGISSATQTIRAAYRMAKWLKAAFPQARIIFGGPHPTALPEDVLKQEEIDLVVMGEGEQTLLQILSGSQLHDIRGISYRTDQGIVVNGATERIADLDALPVCDYSLVPMHLCKPLIGTYQKLPATILVTARGCPGRCTFCSRVVGNQLCVQSAERIIKEIETLYHQYHFRQIIFYDDTFVSDAKRIAAFCDLLVASGMKIRWTCSSRVDKVYPDLLKKMKAAGCHQIMYGIESFNETVLKGINKMTTLRDIQYAIAETRKAGIETRAAIMLGNPGDTEAILNENIRQLKKLNPDLIQVTITTPLPGSKSFHQLREAGKILTFDWDKYDGMDQLFEHEYLSFETLNKYYRKTYLQFYLRPSFVLRSLFKLSSIMKLKVALVGLVSIVPIIFRGNPKQR